MTRSGSATGGLPPSTGTPGPPGSPTKAPRDLAYYLARVPRFGPAPALVPVDLPHRSGHAAWVSRIPTTQNIAFLTIDDGIVKAPDAPALMQAAGARATLFLAINDIRDDPAYFARLQHIGNSIQGHTVSHPDLSKLEYAQQYFQICHGADELGQWYGQRPVIFRPPYGVKNDTTLAVAWSCGLKAVFSWRETVNNGKVYYQAATHMIQPGDIILMHFRASFDADFVAALQAISAAGLTPVLLDDVVHIDGQPLTPEPVPGPTGLPTPVPTATPAPTGSVPASGAPVEVAG